MSKKDKHDRLKKALDKVKSLFDYIILDCTPSLSTFTINALVVADYLLVPAETKYQSDFSLDVFLSSFETIKEMKNPNLKLLGVVATMFNCQANEDRLADKKCLQIIEAESEEEVDNALNLVHMSRDTG